MKQSCLICVKDKEEELKIMLIAESYGCSKYLISNYSYPKYLYISFDSKYITDFNKTLDKCMLPSHLYYNNSKEFTDIY